MAEGRRADLLVANNVLAHVPDLNDFVAGMERVLAPAGVIEFTQAGQFLPATHIPIRHPEALEQARPDFILILPWNLKEEIVSQLSYTRASGARCVVPIPEVEVL